MAMSGVPCDRPARASQYFRQPLRRPACTCWLDDNVVCAPYLLFFFCVRFFCSAVVMVPCTEVGGLLVVIHKWASMTTQPKSKSTRQRPFACKLSYSAVILQGEQILTVPLCSVMQCDVPQSTADKQSFWGTCHHKVAFENKSLC